MTWISGWDNLPHFSSPRAACSGSGALRALVNAAELCRDSLLKFWLILFGLGVFVPLPFSQLLKIKLHFQKCHSLQRTRTKYLVRWGLLMLTPPVEKAGGGSAGEGRTVCAEGDACCLWCCPAAHISMDQRETAFLLSFCFSWSQIQRSGIAREQLQIA